MTHRIATWGTLLIILITSAVCAQEPPTVTVTKLTDQIYDYTTDQGEYTTHALAFVGDDGLLIVDTQAKSDAEEFKKAVDTLGYGTPRYIINTHRHVEHIGGNVLFGSEPVTIAHALYPEKLTRGSYIFEEYPPEVYPDITVADSLTLFFNGDEIRIIDVGGSHDDNEIMVHFTKNKVVHLSSLVNGFNFPSIDADGSVKEFIPLVQRAIELLPDDVAVVSGHNRVGNMDDMRAYVEMLVATSAIVAEGLAAGKDIAQMQEEKVLADWDAYAASYVSTDEWIAYLVEGPGMEAREESKPNLYEPLYYAWKEAGVDGAIAKYKELKSDHPDEYEFRDVVLLVIGIKFLGKGEHENALKFLELNLAEYEEGDYGYYTNYEAAVCYKELGNKELAIQHCEKSLELNPDFAGAATMLEELKE
jgi:glyoxylase-like metal-dependent hydrolase (beta-lactamase superfamily II)